MKSSTLRPTPPTRNLTLSALADISVNKHQTKTGLKESHDDWKCPQ
jgi:hypothetical protein